MTVARIESPLVRQERTRKDGKIWTDQRDESRVQHSLERLDCLSEEGEWALVEELVCEGLVGRVPATGLRVERVTVEEVQLCLNIIPKLYTEKDEEERIRLSIEDKHMTNRRGWMPCRRGS